MSARNVLLILLFIGLFLPLAVMCAGASFVSDGNILDLSFKNDTDNTIVDDGPYHHNGTNQNSIIVALANTSNNARSMDGESQGLYVTDISELALLGNGTMEVCYLPGSGGANYGGIISMKVTADGGSTFGYIYVAEEKSGNNRLFRLTHSTVAGDHALDATVASGYDYPINDPAVVQVRWRNDNYIQLWVENELIGATYINESYNDTGIIYVGYNRGGGGYANGTYIEPRLYDTYLNDSAMAQDYTQYHYMYYGAQLGFVAASHNRSNQNEEISIPVVMNIGSGATVNYTTGSLTAAGNYDYQATNGTLMFGIGETTKYINVTILRHAPITTPKDFCIILSNPTGANLSTSNTTIHLNSHKGTSALSFDDAYMNHWEDMKTHVFDPMGDTCTFYIIYNQTTPDDRVKIKAWHDQGFDTSLHGYESVDAVTYTETHTVQEWLDYDIIPDVDASGAAGIFGTTYAWPAGHHNVALDAAALPYFDILRNTGFLNTTGGVNTSDHLYYKYDNSTAPYSLSLGGLFDGSYTMDDLKAGLLRAKANGECLPLYGHDPVDHAATSSMEVSYDDLEEILQFCHDNDIPVVNMDTLNPSHVQVIPTTSGTEGGNATITLTRSPTKEYDIPVTLTSNDGTAHSTTDYTAVSGVVATIPAGSASTTFAVHLEDDGYMGGDKSFTATISSPTNATLGTNTTCTITIIDIKSGADTVQANKLLNMGWVLVLLVAIFVVFAFLGNLYLIVRSGIFNPTVMIIVVAGAIIIGLMVAALVLFGYISGEIINALQIFST